MRIHDYLVHPPACSWLCTMWEEGASGCCTDVHMYAQKWPKRASCLFEAESLHQETKHKVFLFWHKIIWLTGLYIHWFALKMSTRGYSSNLETN